MVSRVNSQEVHFGEIVVTCDDDFLCHDGKTDSKLLSIP